MPLILEADGTRPMSAYGKIASDSPLMDPSSSDDPHCSIACAEPDAFGTDEGIPEWGHMTRTSPS